MNQNTIVAVLCAGIFGLLPSAQAVSTNTPAPTAETTLSPILVEASRLDNESSRIPAPVQIITAEEIQNSGCSSTADLLEKRGHLTVRKMNASPLLSQIALRGFGENSFGRVLVLVDGERLNNPDMSAPNLSRIPLESISRIEIIRGPQTVLHGDSSSAGIVNIILNQDDPYKRRTTVSGSIGSFETLKGHLSHQDGWEEEGVSLRSSADWERSNGWRENSDYELWNLSGGATKTTQNGSKVSLSAFYSDAQFGLPGSLTARQYKGLDSPKLSMTPNDEARVYSYGFNLGMRGMISDERRLEANLTASRRTTDSNYRSSSYRYETEVDALTFSPRYIDDTDLFGHQNQWIIGVDARYETLDAHSAARTPTTTYLSQSDFSRFSLAAYGQEEWFITEKLSLLGGIRAERFHSRWNPAQNGQSNWSHHEFAYDLALNYRPTDESKIYARASRSYRAPFCDELNYAPSSLTPETAYHAETGTEIQFEKEWTARASLFAMWMKDELFYDPSVPYNYWYGANVNSPARTRRTGLETSLNWEREKVGAFTLAYTYTDARFTEGNYDQETVPLVPRHLLRANGEYTVIKDLSILGGYSFTTSQYLAGDYANTSEKLKPFGLFHAGIRYTPEIKFTEKFSVQFMIDNLLDEKYCDFAGVSGGVPYYYPAAGRMYTVSVSCTF